MKKKTIKFKGIEFEEVGSEEYNDAVDNDIPRAKISTDNKSQEWHYFIKKQKKCSKCGQVKR